MGVQGENNLAIWDLQSGLVVRSCLIKNTNAVNSVKVDPYVGAGSASADASEANQFIQFAVVGNKGVFNIYRYEIASSLLQAFEVENIPQGFKDCDFTTLTFTHFMNG